MDYKPSLFSNVHGRIHRFPPGGLPDQIPSLELSLLNSKERATAWLLTIARDHWCPIASLYHCGPPSPESIGAAVAPM